MLLRNSGMNAAPMMNGSVRNRKNGMIQLLIPVLLLTKNTGPLPGYELNI